AGVRLALDFSGQTLADLASGPDVRHEARLHPVHLCVKRDTLSAGLAPWPGSGSGPACSAATPCLRGALSWPCQPFLGAGLCSAPPAHSRVAAMTPAEPRTPGQGLHAHPWAWS